MWSKVRLLKRQHGVGVDMIDTELATYNVLLIKLRAVVLERG